MLGSLLRALQVTPDQVLAVYRRLEADVSNTPAPIGTLSTEEDYLFALGLDQPRSTLNTVPVAKDRYERFVDAAMAEWSGQMQSLAMDEDAQIAFHLPREQAATVAGEIWSAARRLQLRDRIAQELREQTFGHRSATASQKPVMLVEEGINGFVHRLGYDRVSPAERPQAQGSRPVFLERPAVSGQPTLGPAPAPYDRVFHIDWLTALARMFEDNVKDPGTSALDEAANEALGLILVHLEARRA
jgi:hypothetical protein